MHLIKNVFTDQQRQKLIKDCQPLLVEFGDHFPGRQTHATLHLHPDFISPIKDMIRIIFQETGLDLVVADKAWINWTNGTRKDIGWHTHHCDYALVYYMKTPLPFFSNGTLFRNGLFKAPQNSMIIFPAAVEHTAPASPFRFERYTLAVNLNIVT